MYYMFEKHWRRIETESIIPFIEILVWSQDCLRDRNQLVTNIDQQITSIPITEQKNNVFRLLKALNNVLNMVYIDIMRSS